MSCAEWLASQCLSVYAEEFGTVGYSADRQAGVQPDEVSYATTINALTKARSLNPRPTAADQGKAF